MMNRFVYFVYSLYKRGFDDAHRDVHKTLRMAGVIGLGSASGVYDVAACKGTRKASSTDGSRNADPLFIDFLKNGRTPCSCPRSPESKMKHGMVKPVFLRVRVRKVERT